MKSQLSKAFEPALTSVEVLWQQFDDNAPKLIQVINNAIVYLLFMCFVIMYTYIRTYVVLSCVGLIIIVYFNGSIIMYA